MAAGREVLAAVKGLATGDEGDSGECKGHAGRIV